MKNLNDKPICVVNIEGYYNGFIQQLNDASKSGLLYSPPDHYFKVFNNPKDALDYCQNECSKVVKGNNKDDNRIKIRNDTNTTATTTSKESYSFFEVGVVFIIGTIIGIAISRTLK